MSRIIVIILILLSGFSWTHIALAECGSADTESPASFLKGCASASSWRAVIRDTDGTDGVRALVKDIAKKIIQFGALFAIGAIVFSGIRYTTSAGEDEKIKSAKNTAVYAIVGLVLLLIAFPLVDIVVWFFYGLWA